MNSASNPDSTMGIELETTTISFNSGRRDPAKSLNNEELLHTLAPICIVSLLTIMLLVSLWCRKCKRLKRSPRNTIVIKKPATNLLRKTVEEWLRLHEEDPDFIDDVVLVWRSPDGMNILDPWYCTATMAKLLLKHISNKKRISMCLAAQWLTTAEVKGLLKARLKGDERDEFIMAADGYNKRNCLSYCETDKMVKLIMQSLSPKRRVEFVCHPNSFGRTAVYDFAMYNRTEPLKAVLRLCDQTVRDFILCQPGINSNLNLRQLINVLNPDDPDIKTLLGIKESESPNEQLICTVFSAADGRMKNTPLLYAVASGRLSKVRDRLLKIKDPAKRRHLLLTKNECFYDSLRLMWEDKYAEQPRGVAGFWGVSIKPDMEFYNCLKLLANDLAPTSEGCRTMVGINRRVDNQILALALEEQEHKINTS